MAAASAFSKEKKIGRAKNLQKLQEEIQIQETIVNGIKKQIQDKHNEVISYNEQLKEHAIRQAQTEINSLTNLTFSLHNKMENLHAQQSTSRNRLEEMQLNLERTHASIEGTRKKLNELVVLISQTVEKLTAAENNFKTAEAGFNNANIQFNEYNLQLTRQQSRINSLMQEMEFKK